MNEDNIGALVSSVRWHPLFPTYYDATDLEFIRSPNWVAEAINDGIERKLLPTQASSLDLGCGNGYVVALMAAHGYEACGIDLQKSLVDHARKTAKKLNFLPGKMSFAVGNYLPSDIRERTVLETHVFLQETADPYSALGKMPDDFDVFFIYPFPQQMPSVFDFFRQYARKGARLVTVGDETDWPKARNPGKNVVRLGTPLVSLAHSNECNRRSYSVYEKQ